MYKIPDTFPIFKVGKHSDPEEGMCVMEYASLVTETDFSDAPETVDLLVADYAIMLNDGLSDKVRQPILEHLLPAIVEAYPLDRDAFRTMIQAGNRELQRSSIELIDRSWRDQTPIIVENHPFLEEYLDWMELSEVRTYLRLVGILREHEYQRNLLERGPEALSRENFKAVLV